MTIASNDVRNYFKLDILQARSYALLRQLFKNRYSKFNGSQIWDDTAVCGSAYYANVISKNKNINLTAVQRTSVSNGNTNEWDLTTLAALLMNGIRPTTLTTQEIQQINQEDQLVKQLKDIRNKLAHHASKSIANTEFNQLWADLRSILLALGDIDTELDKLRDDSVFESPTQPINEENAKEAERLNTLGRQAHKDGHLSEAISLFIKATVLAGVPARDRAVFYSNMSSSRLALYEQSSNHSNGLRIDYLSDSRYHALQDAKQARNLWSTWWEGHFRMGKVYAALNEHDKAINSFERALALAPTNGDVKKALDDSRMIQSRQLRQEHLDPRMQPRTIPELLNELQDRLGIDPETVRSSYQFLAELDPTAADVMKGHKYEHGDVNVKQDYEQAARYFAKAASQGNAEGMYCLARLTDLGLGVKKDHNTALKLLEQAAAQPPEHPLLPSIPNPGVAEAEHSLGLRYAEGIAVHKNLPIAVHWYQRAVDHDSAEAANNLAVMYQNGIGVEKNLDKAQQLYELSARKGASTAMLSLAKLLFDTNDLQMAKIWYDRACEAGNIMAQTNRDAFEEMLQQQQKILNQCLPKTLKLLGEMKTTMDSITASKTVYKQCEKPCTYDFEILNEHANRGSITARRMCNALEHFFKAFSILIQNETLLENEENTFLHELSECYRLEHIVAQFPSTELRHKTEQIVDRVLERCNHASNIGVSQLDEDVRACYAVLHLDSKELIAQFLVSCKQKYPKSIYFFELSSAANIWLERYDHSLYEANCGLELDPNYCELLYYKAAALRLIGIDMNETINAYQAFLAVAPNDHRKAPESYYAMASCYFLRDRSTGVTDIVRKSYKQGEEAEETQLPCFLPYKSTSKTLLKRMLDAKSSLDTELDPVIDRKSKLKNQRRIEVIMQHRDWENRVSQMSLDPKLAHVSYSHEPRFKQKTIKSLIGLKSLVLREMNPNKDHIYDGYVLSVTIIEEASTWTTSIHLVIEDEHLDCERMHIYNFPEEQGEHFTRKVFTIGSKMHIINPYLRLGANDLKPLIRVDDFSSVIMQNESERVVNMCRCCGEANALLVCSKCKQARYCSKECQTTDWKLYKHRLICKSQ